jgi:hypothetical protein
MGPLKMGEAAIGRNDGAPIRVENEEAAIRILDVIRESDPEGVSNGDYYIDVERGEAL